MLVSVTYSGMIYPNYSHVSQAMSELHAVGSPIETIAPFLNHYPLSILFVGFGWFVTSCFSTWAGKVSGYLIILHGLATVSAGYFPCDPGCGPEGSSVSHILHGLSGLVVLLTFLVVPAIWAFAAKNDLAAEWFGRFSWIVVLGQIAVLIPTVKAMSTGDYFGLYQRVAYSIPLVWLAVFSIVLTKWINHEHSDAGTQ